MSGSFKRTTRNRSGIVTHHQAGAFTLAGIIAAAHGAGGPGSNTQIPPGASICAIEKAQVEVTVGFHHRRPAAELVREIVDERAKGRGYDHRMMDYNNDPTTHLSDVRTLFAEAIARIQ